MRVFPTPDPILPYFGMKPPRTYTGATILPLGYGQGAAAMTTTATRCYYVPFPVFESRTFSGANAMNSGAGDNGEKFRIMMFNQDNVNGGPGLLAKDFGEITLTGASAFRTLTSAWAATPGMYWGAIWFDSASAMYGMMPQVTASEVGASIGVNMHSFLGTLADAGAAWGTLDMPQGLYVDTTYGTAPSTAVAPTATLRQTFGSTTPVVPEFRLRA